MFRSLLFALGLGLVLSLTGPGAAYAADTGPSTPACADAKAATTAAQTALNAATTALANVPDGSANDGARLAAKERVDLATADRNAKLAAEATACAVVAPSTSATPAPLPTCRPWEYVSRDGRQCLLRDLPRYNSCDEYRSHGVFDIRRGDPRYRDDWDSRRNGIACERTSTEVNGDCTTITTTSRSYTDSVRRWNDLADRYRAGNLNAAQRAELDGAYRDRVRWNDLYNRDRTRVEKNTTCKPPAPVNVTIAAPPANYTAPSQVSVTPRGSANTGDGSTVITPLS